MTDYRKSPTRPSSPFRARSRLAGTAVFTGIEGSSATARRDPGARRSDCARNPAPRGSMGRRCRCDLSMVLAVLEAHCACRLSAMTSTSMWPEGAHPGALAELGCHSRTLISSLAKAPLPPRHLGEEYPSPEQCGRSPRQQRGLRRHKSWIWQGYCARSCRIGACERQASGVRCKTRNRGFGHYRKSQKRPFREMHATRRSKRTQGDPLKSGSSGTT